MADISEIVDSGVQMEKDGIEYYSKLAESATNPLARQMFESFAQDEKNHVLWLEKLAAKEQVEIEEPEQVYVRLREIFQNAPDELKETAKASEDDTQALKIAIGMEVKSKEAYEKWAEELDDPQAKALCKKLAQFEEMHRQAFVNTEEYLNRTGDWFMKEERWMFDGG